jgi:hypothetical protein
MNKIMSEELLDKCEVNLLKRTFTIYGSSGTIEEIKAESVREFESILKYVRSQINNTEYLIYSQEI